jgi:signal transduction histidine kinase
VKWNSLRLRLMAGGIVAILIVLTIAGSGLVVLFERHLARTLADDLDVHLKQILARIDVDPQGNLVLTQPPADPRFADPLSGLYWQVEDARAQLLRSRSLWDTTLRLPADDPAPGELHRHEIAGPDGARMLVAERTVALAADERRIAVRVAVASDLARVSAAASAFAKDLAIALGLLGCVLVIATSIQVALGLRPLDALRRGIADIRAERRRHLPSGVPAEVRPLVEEVNALVDAQDQEIERSRRRAADLAHGLKTPLAALAADATRLRERGQSAIAQDIEAVGEAMRRHVDRELARARVRARVRRGPAVSCELSPLVRSLIATLARTPHGTRVTFQPHIGDDVRVPLDRTDLAEVLGNLLENAARHAKGRVRIAAHAGAAGPSIVIEDDGPGIPAAQLASVLGRGVRLDERGEGAGLGLAIVQDVLDAYDWRLALADAELGGLKATIAPQAVLEVQPTAADRAPAWPPAEKLTIG